MEILNDFIYVNKESVTKAFESLKDNWIIVFTGIIYGIISIGVGMFVNLIFRGPLSIIAGLITYFIQAAIISNYLYLLFNIINYNRFNIEDFKAGFSYFLWKVYGVLFIFYLGQLLLSILGNMFGTAAYMLNGIINFAILIVFNPLPETIYLKSYSPQETVIYSLEFFRENWLNWIILNTILIGIIIFILGGFGGSFIYEIINRGFLYSPIYIIKYLIGQLVFAFMMLYRGHLYKILSTSTRRKRMFMNKF